MAGEAVFAVGTLEASIVQTMPKIDRQIIAARANQNPMSSDDP
jgi:hypothetical protein